MTQHQDSEPATKHSGPPTGRRERNRLQTTLAIEDVATRLFLEHGVDAVTVEQICEGADISRRSFFNYFESKAQLLSSPSASVVTPDLLAEITELSAEKSLPFPAQVVELVSKCGDDLYVYSGEDGVVVPILSMGGKGCISVMSNVVPKASVAMTDAYFRGDTAEAARIQCQLWPLIHCLFSEVNPIPAKAAVSAMGFGEEHLRLPLTPMEPAHRAALLAEMRKLGVV